jgi:hypothetical protein
MLTSIRGRSLSGAQSPSDLDDVVQCPSNLHDSGQCSTRLGDGSLKTSSARIDHPPPQCPPPELPFPVYIATCLLDCDLQYISKE